jgi:predicted nucleotidyltransferase
MFKELNKLKLIFEDPLRWFHVREFAKATKMAPATASKLLKLWHKEKILKHKEERGHHLYKADLDSSYYKDLKTYYSIKKIRDSKIIDALNEFYLHPTIILFGSTQNGLDTKDSDIDLCIVSENEEYIPNINKFEKKLGKEIQLIICTHISEIPNIHLQANIIQGITLQGYKEWTLKSVREKDISKKGR